MGASRPSKAVRVELVFRADWQPLVQHAFGTARADQWQLAASILTSLHDRHVGITPRLALGLAQSLLGRRSEPVPEPWRSVETRLRLAACDAAGLNSSEAGRERSGAFAPRIRASFGYSVFSLAAPLIDAACQQLGLCVLFCDDDHVVSVSADKYDERYAERLEKGVMQLCQADSRVLPSLFWEERALALAGLQRTREQRRSEAENRVQPAMNPPDLGFFLRLHPQLTRKFELPPRDHLPYQEPDLLTRRLPDAGTDGIHVTHDLTEVHRRLLSEWLYPELVQMDRLLNRGFAALRRPPQPVRVRDLLVVAILPGELNRTAAGLLLKTCWFEVVMRLGSMLQRSGLDRSELRWIEGDHSGQHLVRSVLVDQIPAMSVAASDKGAEKYRRRFRLTSGWLPAYLDEHTFHEPIASNQAESANATRQEQTDLLPGWLSEVWKAQKENGRWKESDRESYRHTDPLKEFEDQAFSEQGLDTTKYLYTHLMLFLSADRFGPDNPVVAGPWRECFGAGSPWSSLTLTAAPPSMGDARQWQFVSPWHTDRFLATAGIAWSAGRLAGELISRWIETIDKDLRYGRAGL